MSTPATSPTTAPLTPSSTPHKPTIHGLAFQILEAKRMTATLHLLFSSPTADDEDMPMHVDEKYGVGEILWVILGHLRTIESAIFPEEVTK